MAYYDLCTNQLFVVELLEDGSGDFPLVDLGKWSFVLFLLLKECKLFLPENSLAFVAELVKYQAKPLVIYASTKTDEPFFGALQRNGMQIKTSH